MSALKPTILLLFLLTALPVQATEITLTLDQISSRVKSFDFSVRANAERVYQSKEAVQVARMNLLPKLNIWRALTAVGSLQNAFGLVEDLVPFLVPANWFRVKEQNLFSEAEIAGMRALKANQVATAKSIFLQAVSDQDLLNELRVNIESSKVILDYAKLQEAFGKLGGGTSSAINIRYLSLVEDARELTRLTLEEKKSLALMIGVSAETKIILKGPSESPLIQSSSFDYDSIEKVMLEKSPELAQYDYLYEAARYVKREVQFSLLGSSNTSRGVMGGVFDQYPTQQGLGFGLGPSVRIVKSQRDQIVVQKEAATEVLKRQLSSALQSLRSDQEGLKAVAERKTEAKKYFTVLNLRQKLGQSVLPLELIEGSRLLVEAETAYQIYKLRMQTNLEKISRMKFEGDYADLNTSVNRSAEDPDETDSE